MGKILQNMSKKAKNSPVNEQVTDERQISLKCKKTSSRTRRRVSAFTGSGDSEVTRLGMWSKKQRGNILNPYLEGFCIPVCTISVVWRDLIKSKEITVALQPEQEVALA